MIPNIKKAVCTSFAALLALSLFSCGTTDNNTDSTTTGGGSGTNVPIEIGKETGTTPSGTESEKESETISPETDAPNPPETQKPPESELGKFTESDLGITVNGVRLTIGEDFLPFVDVIGDAEIVEGQACLEGGYDTNYYYGGEDLVVYTLAKDGKQIIYDIYISSPDYATDKGARVGETTREKLVELYGESSSSLPVVEEYYLDDSDVFVAFKFEDDILASIDILDGGVN